MTAQEIETSAMVPAASIVAQVMPLKVIIWSTEVTNVPNLEDSQSTCDGNEEIKISSLQELREHLKNFYSFWLDGKKPIMKSSAVPNKFGDAGDIMFLDNSQQPATPFHDSQNQEQDKAKQAQQPSSMPAENYSHVASQSANLNDSGYP
ncbi:hypothetical protein B566_EDAN013027, partial [Ephemera danica]